MPRSAIATGAVDYVLPPGDIAPAIDRLVKGMKAD
jgi:chemotaxis response regulator CheB